MNTWAIQDAKARFSEFLDACLSEGPQLVTKRGVEAAVLVPVEQWKKIQLTSKPTLKELLLATEARAELVIARRGKAKRQQPVSFG